MVFSIVFVPLQWHILWHCDGGCSLTWSDYMIADKGCSETIADIQIQGRAALHISCVDYRGTTCHPIVLKVCNGLFCDCPHMLRLPSLVRSQAEGLPVAVEGGTSPQQLQRMCLLVHQPTQLRETGRRLPAHPRSALLSCNSHSRSLALRVTSVICQ